MSDAAGGRGPARVVAAALLAAGLLLAGLVAAGAVFAVGWPLPLVERCSGDVCESTLEVDWGRVDWSLKPSRLACGEVNPGPHAALIGPGDVCVVADGTGRELDRASYQTIRGRWLRRRLSTLAASTALAGGAATAAALLVRRRLRR